MSIGENKTGDDDADDDDDDDGKVANDDNLDTIIKLMPSVLDLIRDNGKLTVWGYKDTTRGITSFLLFNFFNTIDAVHARVQGFKHLHTENER